MSTWTCCVLSVESLGTEHFMIARNNPWGVGRGVCDRQSSRLNGMVTNSEPLFASTISTFLYTLYVFSQVANHHPQHFHVTRVFSNHRKNQYMTCVWTGSVQTWICKMYLHQTLFLFYNTRTSLTFHFLHLQHQSSNTPHLHPSPLPALLHFLPSAQQDLPLWP